MSITYIDGLPGFEDADCRLGVQVHGAAVFVKSPLCLSRIELSTGNVDWLIDRSLNDEPKRRVRGRVLVWGKDLWVSEDGKLVAELLPSQDGGLLVSVRDAHSSQPIWEKSIPIEVASDAFFAADDKRLVVCLFRESRRVAVADGKDKLPPYKCQADLTRFEPQTGQLMWNGSFPGLHVSLLERETFGGLWANQNKLGRLDLETGSNAIIHELPCELGTAVSIGTGLAVSWHNNKEVGVNWFDEHGAQSDSCVIPEARVHSTRLHNTRAGLALQLNDAEKLWWLGEHRQPLWNVKAKPYVYRVWRQAGGDVFVATDGNGGRVFGFDADSGHETLNLKPALYGVGSLTRVGESSTLVASFRASKSQSRPPSLLILSMSDRSHRFDYECQLLEGTWPHGAICRTGDRYERLAIIDLREKPEQKRQVRSPGFVGETVPKLPDIGSVYAFKLSDGRYGACRVVRHLPARKSRDCDCRGPCAVVLATPWIGDKPPGITEPQLHQIFKMTHHSWPGWPEICTIPGNITRNFKRIGHIDPSPEELLLDKIGCRSSWRDAGQYWGHQLVMQWEWDYGDRARILAEDAEREKHRFPFESPNC